MIEKHDKVFVSVSVDFRMPNENDCYTCEVHKKVSGSHSVYTKFLNFSPANKSWIGLKGKEEVTHWLEEKNNCYVLTEEEFDFMQSYLSRLQAMLESGETYSFDNEYDFKDSIEIKDFFQSKTNPQTENK